MNRRQLLLGAAAVAVAPLPAAALPARLLDKAEPYQELIAVWVDARERAAARLLDAIVRDGDTVERILAANAAAYDEQVRLHRKHIARLAKELAHG